MSVRLALKHPLDLFGGWGGGRRRTTDPQDDVDYTAPPHLPSSMPCSRKALQRALFQDKGLRGLFSGERSWGALVKGERSWGAFEMEILGSSLPGAGLGGPLCGGRLWGTLFMGKVLGNLQRAGIGGTPLGRPFEEPFSGQWPWESLFREEVLGSPLQREGLLGVLF